MKADRDTFGPQLRQERERRGITLRKIAESTKLKESLFAELERGDLSKWPQGIFRRAHLCAYVTAIGLPSQPILAEFLRLFPPDDATNDIESPKGDERVEAARATHSVEPERAPTHGAPPPRWGDRAWIVAFDISAISLIASVLAGIMPVTIWIAAALAGASYSTVGIGCFGKSIGAYIQHRIRARITRHTPARPILIGAPEVRLVVSRPDRVERTISATHTTDSELNVEERRRASA